VSDDDCDYDLDDQMFLFNAKARIIIIIMHTTNSCSHSAKLDLVFVPTLVDFSYENLQWNWPEIQQMR